MSLRAWYRKPDTVLPYIFNALENAFVTCRVIFHDTICRLPEISLAPRYPHGNYASNAVHILFIFWKAKVQLSYSDFPTKPSPSRLQKYTLHITTTHSPLVIKIHNLVRRLSELVGLSPQFPEIVLRSIKQALLYNSMALLT